MSAATSTVRFLLARAAVRSDALMHVVSQRDSGFLNPVCGAHPIRSRQISEWSQVPADLSALCGDCASIAAGIRGVDTVEQGLAVFVGGNSDAPSMRLLEVAPDTIRTELLLRDAGDELVASVAANGVMTPLSARRTRTGLVLVSGGRRLAAARAAGLASIPVIVREIDEQQAVIDRLLENLHRVDLDPIAQAKAYADALAQLSITKQALADGLGISRSQVSNTIRLLALPEHLQQHVAAGALTAQQARALLACASEAEQDALADQFLLAHYARAGRSRRERTPLDEQLAGIAELLTGVLDAQVRIRAKGDETEIVIVVEQGERARLLERLGVAA